ncbi:MAG: PorV/PorQ family protein, partial [Bacteroidales bacterium]|nr:PorV/PorQ family protein [Bacteroidales bacterium]
MRKRIFYIFLTGILAVNSGAQTGGDNVYEFLNLTHSGLVSSLGGTNVSIYSGNLNMVYHNPSLLSSEMNKSLAMNFVSYFAGINYGQVMYAFSVPEAGDFAAGITYLNYGSFTEADPSGNITGNFYASEYAFSLVWSREIHKGFNAGISLKPVLSHLERYSSFGLAVDIGGSYHSESGLFSTGLTIRNLGVQIST